MSYVLKKYNNTQLMVVPEGVINNNKTSLLLPGENTKSYGKAINENFIWLLENFSNPEPPTNAVRGQIWLQKVNDVGGAEDEKDYDGNLYSSLYVYFGPEVGELIDPLDSGSGIAVKTTCRTKNPDGSPLEYKYWSPISKLNDNDKQWYLDHLDVYTKEQVENLLQTTVASDASKLDRADGSLLKPGTWTDTTGNNIRDTFVPDNTTSDLGATITFEGGYITPGLKSVYRDLELRNYQGQLEIVNPNNTDNKIFKFETDAGNNGWPTISSNSNGIHSYEFIHTGMVGDPSNDPMDSYYLRKDQDDSVDADTTWNINRSISISGSDGSLTFSRPSEEGLIKNTGDSNTKLTLNNNDKSELEISDTKFTFKTNFLSSSLTVMMDNIIGFEDGTKIYPSKGINGYLNTKDVSAKPTLEFKNAQNAYYWQMTPNNGNLSASGSTFNNYSFYRTGGKAHVFDGPVIAKDGGTYKEVIVDQPQAAPQMFDAVVAFSSTGGIYHSINITSVVRESTGRFKIYFDNDPGTTNYSVIISSIDDTPSPTNQRDTYIRKYKVLNRYSTSCRISSEQAHQHGSGDWDDDEWTITEVTAQNPAYTSIAFSWS